MRCLACTMMACLGMSLTSGISAESEQGASVSRTPQFPLKTGRTLYSNEAIARARENVAAYPAAKKIADGITKAANPWLEWSDEDLRDLIPTADVPRAFNVGTAGCPTCGKKIYEAKGTYPWIVDPKKPFKVQCPVCKGVFPDNDFLAYYESGFKDKLHLEGKHADDGWGWHGPDDRYWFVGYANHWTLHTHVLRGLEYLASAYLLTGDKRYAHKAVVILDRIGEVYPGMDYDKQSRYAVLRHEDGGTYHGKLVNHIWACGNLTSVADAYDAVWETVDGDTELQELTGKSAVEIRANIEANILEDGIDAVFAKKIIGNYGMHQRALAFATLSRQHGKSDEWLGSVFRGMGSSTVQTGLDYALYNLVYRDGIPYETSPGYNAGWFRALTKVAEVLKGTERDLYALPKMHRLFDGVLDVVNAGQFTPALGDSGSIYGGRVTNAEKFQDAYRAYGDERYLAHLIELDAVGDAGFQGLHSLFMPRIEGHDVEQPPVRSRVLDGYGMGILNNPKDTISVALYYGYRGGHGHHDRLSFELFANGQPIVPDLGYPDFMNGYVPGIFTWSQNTISHNTVTVDAGRQRGNQAGTVQLFADSPFARVVDIDAPETYPQCSTYRRHLVMVDVVDARSYFVDFFTIEGGSQHDYSLHGPPGAAEIHGGDWRKQEKGTLAGVDVEVGQLYDDPVRGKPDFKGMYSGYTGSGFQHLVNVQRHQGGDWFAHFAHERDADSQLRIRILPQPDTELIVAEAQVSPVKHKQILKYLIARRQGEGLSSRFVSVIEPFRGDPLVAAVERVELEDGATAVTVKRNDGLTDVVVFNPSAAPIATKPYTVAHNTLSAVATLNAAGEPVRTFRAGGAPITGEVTSVDPATQTVRVRLSDGDAPLESATLPGRLVHFVNPRRRTAHPIATATRDGDELVLTTKDDLLVGRARLTAIEPQALKTDTGFMFAPVYRGAHVADARFTATYPLATVETGVITLLDLLPTDHPFNVNEDAWILNVGLGDQLEIPALSCEVSANP